MKLRAALYGLAARFACQRASDAAIRRMLVNIDRLLLSDAAAGVPGEQIIEVSEAIFSEMAEIGQPRCAEDDRGVRRKTRFHFSYVALASQRQRPRPL